MSLAVNPVTLVLRLYGQSLWRWERQERLRVEQEREEFQRRANEAYTQALLRRLRERKVRDQQRWLRFVRQQQHELWEYERWVDQWQ